MFCCTDIVVNVCRKVCVSHKPLSDDQMRTRVCEHRSNFIEAHWETLQVREVFGYLRS